MVDSSEATEVAAEAGELEIVAIQTMEAADMPEEVAEKMGIDIEGRQYKVSIEHLPVCTCWTPPP